MFYKYDCVAVKQLLLFFALVIVVFFGIINERPSGKITVKRRKGVIVLNGTTGSSILRLNE